MVAGTIVCTACRTEYCYDPNAAGTIHGSRLLASVTSATPIVDTKKVYRDIAYWGEKRVQKHSKGSYSDFCATIQKIGKIWQAFNGDWNNDEARRKMVYHARDGCIPGRSGNKLVPDWSSELTAQVRYPCLRDDQVITLD